jgi:uncharacterized lipoprotein
MNNVTGKMSLMSGLVGLTLTSCVAARRDTYVDRFREQAASSFVYSASPRAVQEALTTLVAEDGYQTVDADSDDGVLRTNWRCSMGHCDRLEISDIPVGADHAVVAAFRKAYDAGDITVVETSRATDVEWALLKTLDPDNARRIEARATQRADSQLRAEKGLWLQ